MADLTEIVEYFVPEYLRGRRIPQTNAQMPKYAKGFSIYKAPGYEILKDTDAEKTRLFIHTEIGTTEVGLKLDMNEAHRMAQNTYWLNDFFEPFEPKAVKTRRRRKGQDPNQKTLF